jgi:hypothetical protein
MQPTRRGLLTATGALGVGALGVGALGVGALRPALGQAPGTRAVIELFTSQGCSSCPPADRLLGQLARDPTLVVLSLPVDYWDSLGWRDTFARPAFTRRQSAYAAIRGDGEIYTPQAVVNGTAIAVGSDRPAILDLVAGPLPVRVALAGGVARVEGAPEDAVVVAAPFLRSREVAIGRGENASTRVTYTNIVRDLIALGPVSATGEIRLPDMGDAEGVAVLVQQGGLDRPGRILGAAMR